MASRKEHDELGAVFGIGAALLKAALADQIKTPADFLAVGLGGLVGGVGGSRAPDVLEPATHPGHRSTMHSAVVTSALVLKGGEFVIETSNEMITDQHTDPVDRFGRLFLSSMMVAAPVGYASHILADAGTPAGIPLLTKGF